MTARECGDLLRLRRALEAFQSKTQHFPGCCHSYWINGWNNVNRHEPGTDCPAGTACIGDGAPCSKPCSAARAALASAEAAQEAA